MNRTVVSVAGLLMIVAVAGCSVEVIDDPAPSSSQNPSASVREATTAQYGSAVAVDVARLRPAIDSFRSHNCARGYTAGFATTPDRARCEVTLLTIRDSASSLTVSLVLAETPSSTAAYLGRPPTQLQTLVVDATAAAHTLRRTAGALHSCHGEQCTAGVRDLDAAMISMTSLLDAWKPYL